jgi:nucleotide-binding universal stress UspA family protein
VATGRLPRQLRRVHGDDRHAQFRRARPRRRRGWGALAEEGARAAQAAGVDAQPVAIEATGPVWKTIVDTADLHHAAAIVIGSRGLTGLRSMLLGSVSNAVVHHTERPTLVIHHARDTDAD